MEQMLHNNLKNIYYKNVKTAGKHGINLSSFFELKLLEHLDKYYSKSRYRNSSADAGNRTRAEGLEGPNHSL